MEEKLGMGTQVFSTLFAVFYFLNLKMSIWLFIYHSPYSLKKIPWVHKIRFFFIILIEDKLLIPGFLVIFFLFLLNTLLNNIINPWCTHHPV